MPEFREMASTMGADHEPAEISAVAGRIADAAVRAYRERCAPEPSDEPDECGWGHKGNDDGQPCDSEADWRVSGRSFCDIHAALSAVAELGGDEWSKVQADAAGGGYNREPTPSSEPRVDVVKLRDRVQDIAVDMDANKYGLHSREWDQAIDRWESWAMEAFGGAPSEPRVDVEALRKLAGDIESRMTAAGECRREGESDNIREHWEGRQKAFAISLNLARALLGDTPSDHRKAAP